MLENGIEKKFLNALHYWIKKGRYGVEYDGKTWIYNTLEDWAKMIEVSKRTIQRALRKLRDEGIVEAAFLAHNKRNRTLFYTINYEKWFPKNKTNQKTKDFNVIKNFGKNGHMVDHMIYMDNKNNINKSYKSPDSILENNSEKKSTTVQDMLREFNAEFPNIPVSLTKLLAKNLVAAFKIKFQNSLNEWKKFLKLIKTSAYLTSEKFKLTLFWILKFATIDRIRQGDLGVKPEQIPLTTQEKLEREETTKLRVIQNINQLKECKKCKTARQNIVNIVGIKEYEKYFGNINKCRFVEKDDDIEIEILGQKNFEIDAISEKINLKIRWINDYITVRENGYEFYKTISSFEELDKTTQTAENEELFDADDGFPVFPKRLAKILGSC